MFQYIHIVLQGFTTTQGRIQQRTNLPHLLGHNPEGETNKWSVTNASCTRQWLTQSALPRTVQNTRCYSCQLPSRMNVSKCFSKIFLPFSMIWMASNVTDPLKKKRAGFVLKWGGQWVLIRIQQTNVVSHQCAGFSKSGQIHSGTQFWLCTEWWNLSNGKQTVIFYWSEYFTV